MLTSSDTPRADGRILVNLELMVPDTLTEALTASINDACNRAEDAGSAAVLVIRLRRDRSSPAAADGSAVTIHAVNAWNRALRRIERADATTVAVAEESVGSLGLGVLLTADYRVAAADTQFGMNYAGLGLMPDMTLYRLAQQAGVAASRKLSLFPSPLAVEDAQRLGLVDRIGVQPEAELEAFLDAHAAAMRGGHAVRRRLIGDAAGQNYEQALGPHLAASDRFLRIAATRADQA